MTSKSSGFTPCSLWIGLFPLIGEFLNRARLGHGLQGVQGVQNDASLAFHVAGLTEHTAPRELHKQGPWRFDKGHAIGRVPHGDSRKSRFLCHPLDQTHGLMALGSDRHQEQDIDPLGLEAPDHLRRGPSHERLDVVDIAEAVMRLGQLSDDPFRFQLDEALQR